jgi:DNA polymerase III subunit delta
MKIYANQIDQQLNKGLAPCYLIFGDEPFQIDDCRKKIKAIAKQQGFDEFIRLTNDDQFDWLEITGHVQSLSLFSSKKVIEVELPSNKVGKAGSDMLKKIAPDLGEDTLLVLFGPKLDASQTKSAWFKALDKNGLYIPVYDIDGNHLNRWLQQQLSVHGLTMDKDAQQYLLNFTAGNLLATSQELQKLNMALGQLHIDISIIERFVANQARFSVFQFIDSLWAGNSERCMTILQRLKIEEFEPNIILWSLQKDIMLVHQIQCNLAVGKPAKTVFDHHRIWKNKQQIYLNAAQQQPTAMINESIDLLTKIDYALKTFSTQCPYTMFGHIALLLSGNRQLTGLSLPSQ